MSARILVVDNYDSFVYNLVQYLGQLGAQTIVRRNDAVLPDELDDLGVDGVLISPGPGTPEDAGQSMAFVTACAERALPLFGVCMGHQAIGAVFGSPVVRALMISLSAQSPCRTTLLAPSSTQPPPFGVAFVNTSDRS